MYLIEFGNNSIKATNYTSAVIAFNALCKCCTKVEMYDENGLVQRYDNT